MEDKKYAEIVWSYEDVQAIRPDWSEEECRQWWVENEKWFKDSLTQHGNEILADVLG